MSLQRVNEPPTEGHSYVIPQLEGEIITIPGSKSVFRILASALQSDGAMSVFQSGGVLADAPGFHHHDEAHDIFIVVKGYLKLWNGDRCKILGPGDFASVPPKIIHNPHTLGPHTEIFGLITPGDWVDFFRYVSESYKGILFPENDNRDLRSILIPKVMAAQGKFDVVFHRDYNPPEVSDWTSEDEVLPAGCEPYFLKANTGPRWMLGGVLSRPFITTAQSGGKFAISSIESSSVYGASFFSQPLSFDTVHHCFCILEGALTVNLKDGVSETVREGETVFISAKEVFSLTFASKYVRFWSFSSGDGIESIIHQAGSPYQGCVIPDEIQDWRTVDTNSVHPGWQFSSK